ncbi:hypothetical protein OG871_17380 [Kitasatospora sp. NBC_00374]|uniref:hypothetical protein n=1 Tax=Kitasatospora sp. NBC_00374 TaxID=2975964 RepID=UPI0030E4C1FB
MYEIAAEYVDDPDGYVPPEAVRRGWRVGQDGTLTGEFTDNPGFGPPQDDFARLTSPDHWLDWLGKDPAGAVRGSIAGILGDQTPGAVVEWLKVTEDPRFLTGGRPDPADAQRVTVTRAGAAVPFALSVTAPGHRREVLWGVFTWAAAGLDQPQRHDRVWFDLGADADWAEEQLRSRIYEVGEG